MRWWFGRWPKLPKGRDGRRRPIEENLGGGVGDGGVSKLEDIISPHSSFRRGIDSALLLIAVSLAIYNVVYRVFGTHTYIMCTR